MHVRPRFIILGRSQRAKQCQKRNNRKEEHPSLAEAVKQEEEVPLGLGRAGRGRGWQRGRGQGRGWRMGRRQGRGWCRGRRQGRGWQRGRRGTLWKSQVQAPLWPYLSEPQFPHFKVVKNGDKIHPAEWLRGLNGKNVNMLC